MGTSGQQDAGNVRYVPDWYIKEEGPVSRYRLGNVMYSERLYEPMDKDEYRRRNFGIEPPPKLSLASSIISEVVASVGAIVGAPAAPPAAAPAVIIPPDSVKPLDTSIKDTSIKDTSIKDTSVKDTSVKDTSVSTSAVELEDLPEEQAKTLAKYKALTKEKEEKEEEKEEEDLEEDLEEYLALMEEKRELAEESEKEEEEKEEEEEEEEVQERKTPAEVLETLKDKPPDYNEDERVRDELIKKYERELPGYGDSQKQMYRKEYNKFVLRVNTVRVMYKQELDKAVAKLNVPVQHYTRDNYITLIKNELKKAKSRLASKGSTEKELATYNDDFVNNVLMKKTPSHIRGENNSPEVPSEEFDLMLSEHWQVVEKK